MIWLMVWIVLYVPALAQLGNPLGLENLPVTMRTLDVGGDKALLVFPLLEMLGDNVQILAEVLRVDDIEDLPAGAATPRHQVGPHQLVGAIDVHPRLGAGQLARRCARHADHEVP